MSERPPFGSVEAHPSPRNKCVLDGNDNLANDQDHQGNVQVGERKDGRVRIKGQVAGQGKYGPNKGWGLHAKPKDTLQPEEKHAGGSILVLCWPKHGNFQPLDAAQLDRPRMAERAKERKGDLNNALLEECVFAPVDALVFVCEPQVPLARLLLSIERFQDRQGSASFSSIPSHPARQRRFDVNDVFGDGFVPFFTWHKRVAHNDCSTVCLLWALFTFTNEPLKKKIVEQNNSLNKTIR